MLVSGIEQYKKLLAVEDKRAVEITTVATRKQNYFQDRNPENTFIPEFNRNLKETKRREMLDEKRLRDMRKSEDLMLVYEQMKKGEPIKFVDEYR